MIPQRNLSLPANRLHKEHGGRRIPEAVLERDYCLAWFLVGLGQSRLGQILIFKGGTALKRCHFGDYRFSEDLDFTLAGPAEFAEIREGLEEVFERVAQASGIRFAFEREDRGFVNLIWPLSIISFGPTPGLLMIAGLGCSGALLRP